MKNLFAFLLILFSFTANSQALLVPSNPDSIKVPINYNGTVRTAYVIDLVKYRAELIVKDTATAIRNLIASSSVTNFTVAYGPTADTLKYTVGGVETVAGTFDHSPKVGITGGIVSWSGTGLKFNVTPAVYYINEIKYTSPGGFVTLDPADATNPRKDVIAFNAVGQVIKITGTAAPSPATPQTGPTDFFLTDVFLAPNATVPTDIVQLVAYDENTEWTATATNVTANFNSTALAYHGTKAIQLGNTTASSVLRFVAPTAVNSSTVSPLSFAIKLNGALAGNTRYVVSLYKGTTQTGSVTLSTTYGFSSSNISTWQPVSIPIADFRLTQADITEIRIATTGISAGAYIDYIQFQSGIKQGGITQETDPVSIHVKDTATIFAPFAKIANVPGISRNAFSIVTNRTAGAATYNPLTGVFDIPNYATGGGGTATDTSNLHYQDSVLSARITAEVTARTNGDNLKVDKTTTVNGHSLSGNVTVTTNEVLPAQTGQNGKALVTDGTNASWQTVTGGSGGNGGTIVYTDSTIYVSSWGNDANSGYGITNAKKTLVAAVNLANAKVAANGSKATILQEAGSVFREQAALQYGGVTFGIYNLGDASTPFANKTSFPAILGGDIHNSGWTDNGDGTWSKTFANNIASYPGYSEMLVAEIDTLKAQTQPLSAIKYLRPVTSVALVQSTVGSSYTPGGATAVLTIRTSNGLGPNNNPQYSYEVSVRDKAIEANANGALAYVRNNVTFEKMYVRGQAAGYGGLAAGFNTRYNQMLFHGGSVHSLVSSGGIFENSAIIGSTENMNSGALIWYGNAGMNEHNIIRRSIFIDVPAIAGTHISGGTKHGTFEMNDIQAYPTFNHQPMFFANDVDTVILDKVYAENFYMINNSTGAAPLNIVKNSVFKNVGIWYNQQTIGQRLIFHNNLWRASGALRLGAASSNITNCILHIRAGGYNAIENNTTGTVRAHNNIFVAEFTGNSLFNPMDQRGTMDLDHNIYIMTGNGKFQWRSSSTGSFTIEGLAQWQAVTGQDLNSKSISLGDNPLTKVFVDPDNGNYNLVQGGWGDSIRAWKAAWGQNVGMTTPPSRWFIRPTYEQVKYAVENNSIPSIDVLFSTPSVSGSGSSGSSTGALMPGFTVNANGDYDYGSAIPSSAGRNITITNTSAAASNPGSVLTAGNGTNTLELGIRGLNYTGSPGSNSAFITANGANGLTLTAAAGNGKINFQTNGYGNAMQINEDRHVLINTGDDFVWENKLQVGGNIRATQYRLSGLNTAPATLTSAGTLGELRFAADGIYFATAANTWQKIPFSGGSSGASVAGTVDGQIQFKTGTGFDASTGLSFNKTNSALSINGGTTSTTIKLGVSGDAFVSGKITANGTITGPGGAGVAFAVPAGSAIRGVGTGSTTFYIDGNDELGGTISVRAASIGLPPTYSTLFSTSGNVMAGNNGSGTGYHLNNQYFIGLKSDNQTVRFNENSQFTKLGMYGSYQFSNSTTPFAMSFNSSAAVEVNSTDKGFLPPRMTAAQRTAIVNPAIGLHVYQTDAGAGSEGIWIYKSTGWQFAY
jgi:hypothetical protein